MPTLQLPGGGYDSNYIFSVMAYPNDPVAQDRLMAAGYGYHLTESREGECAVQIPSELLSHIARSPSYTDATRDAAVRIAEAEIAGFLLLCIAKMEIIGLEEPSLRKALHIAEFNKAMFTNSANKRAGVSDTSLRRVWKEFTPVLHLAAAYIVCSTPDSENFIENLHIHEPDNMSRFLNVAEWFKGFAESFKPSRQLSSKNSSEALLPRDVLYAMPEDFQRQQVAVTWGNDEAWLREALNHYIH